MRYWKMFTSCFIMEYVTALFSKTVNICTIFKKKLLLGHCKIQTWLFIHLWRIVIKTSTNYLSLWLESWTRRNEQLAKRISAIIIVDLTSFNRWHARTPHSQIVKEGHSLVTSVNLQHSFAELQEFQTATTKEKLCVCVCVCMSVCFQGL